MHILIVGAPGTGKSTLIRRILEKLDRLVFGYETRKEDSLADGSRGSPIYLYDAGGPYLQTEDRLVGYCKDHHAVPAAGTFDRYAPKLREVVPENGVIVLDEIGFLEVKAGAEDFCAAIMERLDGDIPVIAAVKDKDVPFLEQVRQHPRARCFRITRENREQLISEVVEFMMKQEWFGEKTSTTF